MFQTKGFLSIVASLVNRMRARTTLINDYSVGSVARTMLEAPAQEIDELYQQMVAGLVEAVPVATYRSFDFGQLQAAAATGTVRVQITPQAVGVVIPAGSNFTQAASSVVFQVTVDCAIPAGNSFGDVALVATTAGQATNVPANTVFAPAQPPVGFLSASNLVAFIDGRDLETAAQQKTRFNAFIATLPRGTPAALAYAARDLTFLTDANGAVTEQVAFVNVDEPYERGDTTKPLGEVDVYIHNGVGSTSMALVLQAQTIIYGYYDGNGNPVPGYKAAGAHVTVYAATEQPVPVTAALSAPAALKPGLVTQATSLIAAYILGLPIGATCVAAKITQIVMDLPGVTDFVFTVPLADTTANYATKNMPGAIAIS